MHYKHTEKTVKVPDNDTDVTLVLPSGEKVVIQWRIEHETVDICFEEGVLRTVYVADEHMLALRQGKDGAIRRAAQITLIGPDNR